MLSRCQEGGLHHLWSKKAQNPHNTQQHHDEVNFIPEQGGDCPHQKKNVSITPFFIFLRSSCDCATVESTVWLPSCSFFTIGVVVVTRKPLTSLWPYFLFRIHQKRLPIFPNDICWISCFDADGNQLFEVIGRFSIIFFVVVLDREDDPTTLCWGPS